MSMVPKIFSMIYKALETEETKGCSEFVPVQRSSHDIL